MRLGTYSTAEGAAWRAAAFIPDDRLIDLSSAARWLATQGSPARTASDEEHPACIRRWLTPEGRDRARAIIQAVGANVVSGVVLQRSAVIQGPPVPDPAKFIAVGRNYMNHVREGQRIWAARGKKVDVPAFPSAFVKFASSIVPHGTPVILPSGVSSVDYELELAVVIGQPCHQVSEDSALDYVAGYTICNDMGARDIQKQEMEAQIGITLSKNFPGFAPLGPWLVTADEIPDPQKLDIRLCVNGEQRQHSNTAEMIFSVARLVSYWSQVGLEPGDIITTGTPAGVALARPDPAPFYLKSGDVVTATIEGIGTLENPIQ